MARIIYTYKGKEYYSAYQVRQAIWQEERKAFNAEPEEDKPAFWSLLGVEYKVEETTFDELKNQKLSELERAFNSWYQDGAILESSLGFEIDADQKAMLDVNGLVTVGQPAVFMDANNVPHQLTLEELKVLQLEIIQAGGLYYQQKWVKREAIYAATSKLELNTITTNFEIVSFQTPKEEGNNSTKETTSEESTELEGGDTPNVNENDKDKDNTSSNNGELSGLEEGNSEANANDTTENAGGNDLEDTDEEPQEPVTDNTDNTNDSDNVVSDETKSN